MSVTRPLVLSHGSLETTILIPSDQYLFYQQLTSDFKKTLPEPTEGFADDDEPSSKSELLTKFLGYIIESNSIQSEKEQSVKLVLEDFESRYLQSTDIHTFASQLLASDDYPTTLSKINNNLIKNYFAAKVFLKEDFTGSEISSALLKASKSNNANIFAIFGGQGNTDDYFEELREIYSTYNGLISPFLIKVQSKLQQLISSTDDINRVYTDGFDFLNWLKNPTQTPSTDNLLSIPVSCPLICVIQLCHYIITCKTLGVTPGQFKSHLNGTTGHSQGLVTSLVVASADSWESFETEALKAVELLFYLSVRCLQAYPSTSLAPSMVKDSEENGEGKPGPMLSIRDLSVTEVENFVNQTNQHLPSEKHIKISLINGARNVVVSGPPESLYGLNLNLRNAKASSGLDQSRIPYSQRRLKFSSRFLPIHSPFHSDLLAPATPRILEDFKKSGLEFNQSSMTIPVYDTFNGKDLREYSGSLSARVVECINTLAVNWEQATNFKATHLIDFGPGGVSGLGVLTYKNKEGTGARIIVAGVLDAANNDAEYGFKQEIFDKRTTALTYAQNWLAEFQPKLIKTKEGKVYVDTKFSRLLSRAPLMVPGMTPTTVSPSFVSAAINAGYNIEIAGGGYFNEPSMEAALKEVAENVTPGSGIGINLIYVNPRMLQWGIPMIKKLRERGFPIESLTIGAGVPSLEVAGEYIETLGLTYLGLKPGSIDAISQCITIAKAYPNFPIVVQWTGGRGGGHHSFEDFHQPILQMYARIRRCSNIILVAGSGFGSAEDTYPYLTGTWSKAFNYPEMPFDGFLFGSRVMAAKEALTSEAAKKLIAECPGVPDGQWEQTYKKPTGGILTVKSEMGEPIHKIATRAVKFWKEIDDTVLSLPKNKMLEALDKKRDYIISKLNADYQKPWFGKNADGVCDVKDMTYQEIAQRCVELMYIKKLNRWIDPSLRDFTGKFLRRVEERFANQSTVSVIQNFAELDTPTTVLSNVFSKYPAAKTQLVNAEDVDFFIASCLNPMQKPVPFVPILNEKFEFFFKKDSLWQSEHLESVVDEDVQRTCILHGPVAAQFVKKVDEPIKDIMDSIHEGHIAHLLKDVYSSDESKIPVVEYFSSKSVSQPSEVEGVTITKSANDISYTIDSTVPYNDKWFKLLAGDEYNWRHAFISSDIIVQGYNHVSNPARKVLAAAKDITVKITNPSDASKTTISLYGLVKGNTKEIVNISFNGSSIIMKLIETRTADGNPIPLELYYSYIPSDGFAPIAEDMTGRNERIKEFYWKVWFGMKEPVDLDFDVSAKIDGGAMEISSKDISELTHAVSNSCEYFVPRAGRDQLAPMDFAIVIGWKAIMKSIFPKAVDGDILKLVHLSNAYTILPNSTPLKVGDKVSSDAEIVSVVNGPTGKTVEVVGTIYREGNAVMQVTSAFFYRGSYTDFENTFEKTEETPAQVTISSAKDAAVLQSKEWFHVEEGVELLNKSLIFRLKSVYKFKSANVYSYVSTTGNVYYESPTKEIKKAAEIEYSAAYSFGNPVIDYLKRNGTPIEQPILFENPIPLARALETKAPTTNEAYAVVSGDFNPIHVSRIFAAYADLPGTITHGMYSSASVRSLVEMYAADAVAPRVIAYKANFTGMVLPNDELSTKLEHVGMINGRKIIKIETKKIATDELVLAGEAEIEQPVSTFVFTGQGSQEQGMGMDLYNSSEVAKAVWDRADKHLVETYGFSILDIVKNNPNELTVHFGGPKGRTIRENYISMMFETIDADGSLKSEKIFKEIDENTAEFTFRSPSGLLSATQFTQPALTLMEKAAFEDMKSKGLVPAESMFAGHSLGEYSALSSLADVMPIESLVDVVFYRGMTMQVAVPRDSLGRSNYGMCAVNPSRISSTFNDAALRFVVDHISKQTGWLLEIVNYNVENQQYVTAGDLRALDTLTNTLNVFKLQKIDIVKLQEMMSIEKVAEHLSEIVEEVSQKSLAKPQPIELERGFACIPLKGISVPFHSSYLKSGVKPFKRFLEKKIPMSAVKPASLIGKYIPNLTAKPFQLTKEYFQDVYDLTSSEKIKEILDHWEEYEA
ncbi:beta subunit of fatty acid synthetase [Pichia californica]|uniref:Fatty acid synthase subunit beta n=1 Tax=Pichia californica TaxID=460514 RepID=A0A9P7BIC1_9ASCO|nr:beta subunit of fatty acid synthetase [[Candida] californica]KAG0691399.1 beta subunit of fatty acid synthetase [[Candida] californica]